MWFVERRSGSLFGLRISTKRMQKRQLRSAATSGSGFELSRSVVGGGSIAVYPKVVDTRRGTNTGDRYGYTYPEAWDRRYLLKVLTPYLLHLNVGCIDIHSGVNPI